jgi:Outer membrane protein beta-barrel domain
MRLFLFLLMLSFASGIFAQKNNFEVVVAPYQPFVQSSIIKIPFIGKGGVTLGGHFLHNFKKNYWFVMGLEVSGMKYKMKNDILQWPSQHDGNGGFIDDPNINNRVKYNHISLQIPVLLRYEFAKKKYKPFLQGGLVQSTEIYFREQYKTEFNSINYTKEDTFKRNIISGRFSTGMNFPIKGKAISVSIFGNQSIKVFQREYTSTTEGDIFLQLGMEIGYRF